MNKNHSFFNKLKHSFCQHWQIFSILLLSIFAFLLALYLQYFYNEIPCVLCIGQRVALVGAAITGLVSLFFKRKVFLKKAFIWLALIFTTFGIYFSGRQVYLEHIPLHDVGACAPDFYAMLQIFSPYKIVQYIFYGTPECSKGHSFIFGFTLAETSLILFSINLVLFIWYFFSLKVRFNRQ